MRYTFLGVTWNYDTPKCIRPKLPRDVLREYEGYQRYFKTSMDVVVSFYTLIYLVKIHLILFGVYQWF